MHAKWALLLQPINTELQPSEIPTEVGSLSFVSITLTEIVTQI